MYIITPPKNEGQTKFAVYENAFSKAECEKVIALFNPATAIVAGTTADSRVNEGIRKSRLNWLVFSEEHRWLWDKLALYVNDVNKHRWKFQLHGMLEALQLTEYPPGGHYTWHEDNSEPVHSTRKLSLVLQLTSPEDYEGGDLVIFPNYRPTKSRGTLTFFPSYYTHKVEPVKSGLRYSLVAWVTGDPFR